MFWYSLGLWTIQLLAPDHPHIGFSSWFRTQYRRVIGWLLQKSLSHHYPQQLLQAGQVAAWRFCSWVSARWSRNFREFMKVTLARNPNNIGHGTWTNHHLQPASLPIGTELSLLSCLFSDLSEKRRAAPLPGICKQVSNLLSMKSEIQKEKENQEFLMLCLTCQQPCDLFLATVCKSILSWLPMCVEVYAIIHMWICVWLH